MKTILPAYIIELPYHQCEECLYIQAVKEVIGKSVSGQVIVRFEQGHDKSCSHFNDNGKTYIVVFER